MCGSLYERLHVVRSALVGLAKQNLLHTWTHRHTDTHARAPASADKACGDVDNNTSMALLGSIIIENERENVHGGTRAES